MGKNTKTGRVKSINLKDKKINLNGEIFQVITPADKFLHNIHADDEVEYNIDANKKIKYIKPISTPSLPRETEESEKTFSEKKNTEGATTFNREEKIVRQNVLRHATEIWKHCNGAENVLDKELAVKEVIRIAEVLEKWVNRNENRM